MKIYKPGLADQDPGCNKFHPEKRRLRKRLRAARKANRNNMKTGGERSK